MPKPFRFNLEKVLDVRAQLEEQAKMELAKALAALRNQELLIKDLQNRLAAQDRAFAKKKTVTPADIWLWRTYKTRLAFDINQAKARLKILEAEAQKRRQEVALRAKDKKLLEKLKSNQAVRHAREENLKEQNEFDEMATARFEPQIG